MASSVHPKARPEYDAGPVPQDLSIPRMTLVLRRSATQQNALDALVASQQDPQSPEFHKWLTPEEFGGRFGLSQNDLDKLTTWLRQSGFAIDEISKGRWTIIFSGTAGQVQTAFHTQIHYYNLNGTRHRANTTPLEVPKVLSPVLEGVLGVHDFLPVPVARGQLAPNLGTGGAHYLAASDYATIYDINPLYSGGINGTGQTIAIVGTCNIDTTVVQSFRALMGLPANNTSVVVAGQAPPACTGDQLVEPYLDVEWSGAVATNANVVLVIATDIGEAANYIVNNNLAPVVSTSFSSCEADNLSGGNAFWANLWEQAASNGITSLVSSGDWGAAGCDDQDTETMAVNGLGINGICSTPYSVCVGGSELNDFSNPSQYWSLSGPALGYIPEEAWNESGANGGSGLWATGGGFSIVYPTAPWQTGNQISPYRGVPDVSMPAAEHDGYIICMVNSECNLSAPSVVFGTSAASPSFAGIIAMVVQKAGRQGAANAALYALGSRTDVFHDIVLGNNSVPGQLGYSTGIGWDPVTGLGSVDANSMVSHWGSGSVTSPVVSVSTSTVTFGNQPIGTTGSSQTVTIKNTGNATLNISSISFVGSEYGDFPSTTTCPLQGALAAGASCILTIAFKPTAIGTRTASIVLTDSASGSPQTISISGTGTSTAGPTLLQAFTSNVSGISNGQCNTPAQVTSFSATSSLVWLNFSVNGANIGDTFKMSFNRPDGVNYTSQTAVSSYSGGECFSEFIYVAGYPPASYPGVWTVQTFWNQSTKPLFTLAFTITPASALTIQTVPAGLQFSLDGGPLQTAPKLANLVTGSTHSITLATLQPGPAGIQYAFTGWSDGGAASQSFVVNTSGTLTANFETQYQLTLAALPSAGGTISSVGSGYYNAGTVISLAAQANSGYAFTGWTGGVANAGVTSTTISMTAPETITANFKGTNIPAINPGGVVPLFSSVNTIAPGSWVSVYGSNLVPTSATWSGSFQNSTSLGGVSVTIDGKPAYISSVTKGTPPNPDQINIETPDDTVTGSVAVVVTNPMGRATSMVTVATFAPSFSLLDNKHVAGIILTPSGTGAYGNGAYDIVGPVGAFPYPTRPVKAGETLILYGVGFGPTNPPVPAGVFFSGAAPAANQITMTIGGSSVPIGFAGISYSGQYQFNVVMPNTAGGDRPIIATVGGVQSPANFVVTVD